jgi:hypothetical protein
VTLSSTPVFQCSQRRPITDGDASFQGVASVLLSRSARWRAHGSDRFSCMSASRSGGRALRRDESALIRSVLASPQGTIKFASLYGPFVWMVMSLAVIPLLAHRPPTINIRWWVQLIGHIPFVGFPIAAAIGTGSSRAN